MWKVWITFPPSNFSNTSSRSHPTFTAYEQACGYAKSYPQSGQKNVSNSGDNFRLAPLRVKSYPHSSDAIGDKVALYPQVINIVTNTQP
jgi:hypothetical protein